MAMSPDIAEFIKLHIPTIDAPVPKMGAGLVGVGDFAQEFTGRLPEFVMPGKMALVGAMATTGGLIGRQFFEGTVGQKTPAGFYGWDLLWSIPAIMGGKFIANAMSGPPILQAIVLGTVANGILQFKNAMSGQFTMNSALVSEALLVPLSLLLVERAGK